jgi:hypothetical protein
MKITLYKGKSDQRTFKYITVENAPLCKMKEILCLVIVNK